MLSFENFSSVSEETLASFMALKIAQIDINYKCQFLFTYYKCKFLFLQGDLVLVEEFFDGILNKFVINYIVCDSFSPNDRFFCKCFFVFLN